MYRLDMLCFLFTFPKVSTFIEFLKAFEDTGGKKTGGRNRQGGRKGQDEKGTF